MISICIAMHNGKEYILEELKTMLPQIGPDDEIVISDDGSTDGSINAVLSLNDDRIKVYQFRNDNKIKKTNYYVAMNFENALKMAKGDIIFLADQDDLWAPNKVEECMKLINENDLVMHEAQRCDKYGNPMDQLLYDNRFRHKNYFLKKGKYYGCVLAFNRKVLDVALPFPPYLQLHDHWLGLIGETIGRMAYIRIPLMYYRQHDNNVSAKSVNNFFEKIFYRVYFIWNFFMRIIKYKNNHHNHVKN